MDLVIFIYLFIRKHISSLCSDIKDGPLLLDDLATLVDFLDPVASKWEDMGIQLDISAKKLDNLKATGGGGEEGFLRKMLNKLESTNPNQTVERLCNALSSGPVGEKAMSESLRDKYARQGMPFMAPVYVACILNIWYPWQHSDGRGTSSVITIGPVCVKSHVPVHHHMYLHPNCLSIQVNRIFLRVMSEARRNS